MSNNCKNLHLRRSYTEIQLVLSYISYCLQRPNNDQQCGSFFCTFHLFLTTMDDKHLGVIADFDLFLFFNHRCYVLYKHFCSVATQEITEIMKNGKLLVFTQLLEATLTKRAGC